MNLKFYLRGLGIGIVVTAIIMLVISSKTGKSLSDEEIKQRAKNLGMVEESTTLSSLAEVPSETENVEAVVDDSLDVTSDSQIETPQTDITENTENTETLENDRLDEIEQVLDDADAYLAGEDNEVAPVPTETPMPTETSAPTKSPEPTSTPAPTATPTAKATPTKKPETTANTSEDAKSFTISSGQDSYTVAKNLQSAGLISDASSFDTYLCQTGLDRKIKAGSYVIDANSTEEQIAKMIAK